MLNIVSDLSRDGLEGVLQSCPETLSSASRIFDLGQEIRTDSGVYKITGSPKRGGFSEVYKARNIKTQEVVAVKALPAYCLSDKVLTARFVSEIKTLQRLSREYCVEFRDVGLEGNTPFYVMEYFELMLSDADNNEQVARRALLDLCACCSYLSNANFVYADGRTGHGIVHRDIKPENVGLTTERFKLIDFGAAVCLEGLPARATRICTRPFSPVEQVNEGIVSSTSDTHSIAMTFLNKLTYVGLELEFNLTKSIEFVEDTRCHAFDNALKSILKQAGRHWKKRPTPAEFGVLVSEHFNKGGTIFRENAAHSRSSYSLPLQQGLQ